MLLKASVPPSGDHVGQLSAAGLSVSCRWPFPSTPITQMSRLPERSDTYATVRPSGDSAGCSSTESSVVSWTGLSPPSRR